jgi:hypothetical protein
MKDGLVTGSIVATYSSFDTAVGFFYPLGAAVRNDFMGVAPSALPKYGGMGTFGIQGLDGQRAISVRMGGPDFQYCFENDGAKVYNLDDSNYIRGHGPPKGGHNDIVHPEVAHAFWAAVVSSIPVKPRIDTDHTKSPTNPNSTIRGSTMYPIHPITINGNTLSAGRRTTLGFGSLASDAEETDYIDLRTSKEVPKDED